MDLRTLLEIEYFVHDTLEEEVWTADVKCIRTATQCWDSRRARLFVRMRDGHGPKILRYPQSLLQHLPPFSYPLSIDLVEDRQEGLGKT